VTSGVPQPDLAEIARLAMIERGLRPEFSDAVRRQVVALRDPGPPAEGEVRDLRGLPWCSIDNDDSRDLDQLTLSEAEGGAVRILVAVADVDARVAPGSPADEHARHNTTSVYTPARVFSMLPERLSTDLTSLNPREDRLAVVTAYTVGSDGEVDDASVFRAQVRNQARLTYNAVAAWLDGKAPPPPGLLDVPGLAETLRVQDEVARRLRVRRHEDGALDLATVEARAVVQDGQVVDLRQEEKNRSRAMIEDFMIAANGVNARFLQAHGFATLRRVVRAPERWDRLEQLAREHGERLPHDPDSGALAAFLSRRREADPLRYPDLSLAVVKLMGAGEYAVEDPGGDSTGHFGLAARDYLHSTAPNRRYPDLVTQRTLKAALRGDRHPYARSELVSLAAHCTLQEDAASRVERQMRKSAAALLLSGRVGETFDALVTGVTRKGTWLRVLHPPIEGRLVRGENGLDVGDEVRVGLVSVDVLRGHIDFERASTPDAPA
jgi:exoribonuclease II